MNYFEKLFKRYYSISIDINLPIVFNKIPFI